MLVEIKTVNKEEVTVVTSLDVAETFEKRHDHVLRDVEKLKKELGDPDCKVVATGGLSQLLDFDGKKFFDVVDRGLSLEGLNIVYNLNQKQ